MKPALWRRVVRFLRDRVGQLVGENEVITDGTNVYYVNRHGRVVRHESTRTYISRNRR